jgi:hypothetical protein
MEFGAPVGPENYAEALNRISDRYATLPLFRVLPISDSTDVYGFQVDYGLLDGKINGAVDLADRPVPSDNMARLLGGGGFF